VILVDSNTLIYAAQPAHAHLRRFIADHAPAVSAVSYVEVLGYHQLDDQEQQYLEESFRLARVYPSRKLPSTKRWRSASSGGCPSAMLWWQARRWCMS
jgi:hypothetical protein